jgi:hypothetical protein
MAKEKENSYSKPRKVVSLPADRGRKLIPNSQLKKEN